MNAKCETCRQLFKITLKNNPNRFCSRPCYSKWRKDCYSVPTHVRKKISKSLKGKKRPKEFGKKMSLAMMGEGNHRWRGGIRRGAGGYILRKARNHPFAQSNNYVAEHRLVMEQHLGRYLTREEQVHHINGVRSDNRLENLILFSSKGEHSKHHWYLGSYDNRHKH